MIPFLKRGPLHSTERVQRYNRRFAFGAIACALFLAAVLSLAAWGSRREEVTISKITVAGAASVSEKDVRAFADAALAGSYLGLFPRRNSFLYPKDAMESTLP